jgi:hypothetical protein
MRIIKRDQALRFHRQKRVLRLNNGLRTGAQLIIFFTLKKRKNITEILISQQTGMKNTLMANFSQNGFMKL